MQPEILQAAPPFSPRERREKRAALKMTMCRRALMMEGILDARRVIFFHVLNLSGGVQNDTPRDAGAAVGPYSFWIFI